MIFRRITGVFLFTGLLLTLLMAAGCGSHEPVPVSTETMKNELMGKKWYCQYIFKREIILDKKPFLEFLADGTVQGSGGCNSLSASYDLDGEKVSFGPFRSTKKSCGPAYDEQEFTFHTLLSTIVKVKVDDDELHLFRDNDPTPMVFTTEKDEGLFW